MNLLSDSWPQCAVYSFTRLSGQWVFLFWRNWVLSVHWFSKLQLSQIEREKKKLGWGRRWRKTKDRKWQGVFAVQPIYCPPSTPRTQWIRVQTMKLLLETNRWMSLFTTHLVTRHMMRCRSGVLKPSIGRFRTNNKFLTKVAKPGGLGRSAPPQEGCRLRPRTGWLECQMGS